MKLSRAIEAAEKRKRAGLGDDASGLTVGSVTQERSVFSGFDLEYDELVATSHNAAQMFMGMAADVGLYHLLFAAWIDGLLVGLLAASLPPEPPASDAPPGAGGGEG